MFTTVSWKRALISSDRGALGIHNFKVLLSNHYQMIKKYDKELFPIVLAVSAVALLCINALLTLFFFSAGTLYAVWKGDKWKEYLVKPLETCWNDSNLAKVALIAAAVLFAAPDEMESCRIWPWHLHRSDD